MWPKRFFWVKAGIFIFTVKSRLSYRESHQDKLGIGQNDVPEFNGDNFETFGTLPEKINSLLEQKVTCSR